MFKVYNFAVLLKLNSIKNLFIALNAFFCPLVKF